jgi:hypothetical protein
MYSGTEKDEITEMLGTLPDHWICEEEDLTLTVDREYPETGTDISYFISYDGGPHDCIQFTYDTVTGESVTINRYGGYREDSWRIIKYYVYESD